MSIRHYSKIDFAELSMSEVQHLVRFHVNDLDHDEVFYLLKYQHHNMINNQVGYLLDRWVKTMSEWGHSDLGDRFLSLVRQPEEEPSTIRAPAS